MNRKLLESQLNEFFDAPRKTHPVYNEFSLQHEMGTFLRRKLVKEAGDMRVDFERPYGFFLKDGARVPQSLVKKEIDLAIYEAGADGRCKKPFAAIELKYPRNKAVPRRLFQVCTDVKFLEQLIDDVGFKYGFAILVADDPTFWSGTTDSSFHNLYRHFRKAEDGSNLILKGTVKRSPGTKDKHDQVSLRGSYAPFKSWCPVQNTRLHDDTSEMYRTMTSIIGNRSRK